jgi:N-carbamoylputrescine amidase
MSAKTIRVALVQHACTDDPADNLRVTMEGVSEAAAAGAQLVLLQELHRSRYFCQTEDTRNFDLAETIPGPSTQQLGELAQRLGVVIVASLFEQRAAGLYHNTAVVLERDGTLAGRYRKMHIPDDPAYYEKFYFTPGDLGFQPIDTSVGRLGVLVCWDQWYPEAARLMALAGAELLLYPTAIGWETTDSAEEQARQREAWLTVQRGHAISNGLPVLTCNRVGHEPDPSGHSGGIRFWGSSAVIGAQGELLGLADTEQATRLVIDVDLGRSEQVRRIWPFLRDRRVDAYADLVRRYRD